MVYFISKGNISVEKYKTSFANCIFLAYVIVWDITGNVILAYHGYAMR